MPIEIKHRNTGAVLHTVDADTLYGAYLTGADLRGAYLTGADLRGAGLIGAGLSGADLRGAELSEANLRRASLSRADLSRADLRWADLRWADLSEADLRGADLYGAYLYGAYLYGANLSGAAICDDKMSHLLARATRLDGHEFFLFALQEGSPKIKAGCRWMTIDDYRAHVAKEYPDTDKARETLDILNFFEARAQ